MKKYLLILLTLCFTMVTQAQDSKAGELQLGMRTTYSIFGTDGYPGMGLGGQFRLRLADRLNSEWFSDFITTDLDGLGERMDAHIGWSVMFYPLPLTEKKLQPYLLAGHCFDYTKVTVYQTEDRLPVSMDRRSMAIQSGLGTHIHLSDRFDFSTSLQYMLHIGKDIHVHREEHNGVQELHFIDEDHAGAGVEGHLFLTFSVNYKIADLW